MVNFLKPFLLIFTGQGWRARYIDSYIIMIIVIIIIIVIGYHTAI